MKRIFKVWKVIDERTGEVVFAGRKRDAVRYWYPRNVYSRQTYLNIYSTSEDLA